MSSESRALKRTSSLMVALSCIALVTIGGVVVASRKANIADQEYFFAPVPKAVCGPGDKPEMALQGQVPYMLRAQPGGFQGFNCNLQLIGQVLGEGANWQTAEFRERRGRNRIACAYHGTAAPTAPNPPRTNLGVRVIDISDPAKPYNTAYLTTTAMLDPWESLKVNERRKLLAADNGQNGGAGPELDVYDVSGDCRYPQLLASRAVGVDPGIEFVAPVRGHEGKWAQDGMTYYGSGGLGYFAVDMTDTTRPKLLANWRNPAGTGGSHGLSVSEDGMRGYFISSGNNGLSAAALADPAVPPLNGVVIYDLSDVQARKPDLQIPVVSTILWKDGAIGQHTIPVTIGRKPYVIAVDEAGSGGIGATAFRNACATGLTLFPLARIIDIGDERNPRIVSKLMLEVHDPANCEKIEPDLPFYTSSFFYGSHYCSVDNTRRATTLACGYFNSGIRVFDIRDPIRPREIAYYNPAGVATASPGANHVGTGRGWVPGSADWCSAQVHLDADLGTVWTTCQDNGVLSLKFTHNAWPFAESRTPPGWQN